MARCVVDRNVDSSDSVVGGQEALSKSYNRDAGAIKNITHIVGRLVPRGPANTALGFDPGSLVALYNDSASTAFVRIGPDNTVAAPTGASDGVALRPYDYTIIAIGVDRYVRSNTATVYAYEVADDTVHFPKRN